MVPFIRICSQKYLSRDQMTSIYQVNIPCCCRFEQAGANQTLQLSPFKQQVLCDDRSQQSQNPHNLNDILVSFLPASRRSVEDNLDAFSVDGLRDDSDANVHQDFLVKCHDWSDEEVNIKRLADVQDVQEWLWTAGRPMPPRPLHQQLLMNRNVMINERMDLHLVWTTGRIFMKPLPRFILEPRFWQKFICCRETAACHPPSCDCSARWASALGSLFTYAALIMYESDFHIAKEKRFLPEEVQWPAWKAVIREVLSTSPFYSKINPRFHYNELRLSRLNKLYFFWKTPMRNYMTHWHQYGSLLHDHFAWLASSTIYRRSPDRNAS